MRLDPGIRLQERDDVYPPSEDSYLLLESIDLSGSRSFLEIGAGTGLIALHAARYMPTTATDISRSAVRLCRENARLNDLPLEVVQADLFHGLKGRFDIIAFNPPYLPVEEEGDDLSRSWAGGPGGNRVILRFLREARNHVAEHGRIYLILSSHNRTALEAAARWYHLTEVGHTSLFFEEIAAYELRPFRGVRQNV